MFCTETTIFSQLAAVDTAAMKQQAPLVAASAVMDPPTMTVSTAAVEAGPGKRTADNVHHQ